MKTTPLHSEHLALGAKMVDFAGWHMPLQYPSGISQEHLSVRTAVGLFDVSHMAELTIIGEQALEFLSYTTLNDPAKLKVGQGQYSMLPNDTGGLIDDIYLYREDNDEFLMIANAANQDKVVRHLMQLAENYRVDVIDASDSWALLALQGPGSALLLGRLVKDDLSQLKKNRKMVARYGTGMIDIARTGYTGEDGFEILVRPDMAVTLWRALLTAGAKACGLAARDTLRLEAGFPLYGHELTEETNPLCTDYAWVVKDKNFFGREAMWHAECPKRLVGLKLLQRGIARQGHKLFAAGKELGEVSSGTISPFTRDSIALAWIDAAYSQVGQELQIEVRGERLAATVSKTPFFSH